MNIYEVTVNGYTWTIEASKVYTAVHRAISAAIYHKKVKESDALTIKAKVIVKNKT